MPTPRVMKMDGPRITTGEVVFPTSLWQTPNAIRASEFDKGNSQGYFIDSVNGVKFFAYVGLPTKDIRGKAVSESNKVPAVVCVHGGGGIAFYEWVDFWTNRGYAAIAMCTDQNVPTVTGNNQTAISNANHTDVSSYSVGGQSFNLGPDNPGGFSDYRKPVIEQWAYHAIATVIASNSFIRSFPVVDGTKVALTGISYGSFLTCQAAAHDDRYACAVPIYGSYCQSIGDTNFSSYFNAIGEEGKAALWDNDAIMEGNKTPFYFVNSNLDQFFSILGNDASCRAMQGSKMVLKHNAPHSHEMGGMRIAEVHAYIDSVCYELDRIPTFTKQPTIDDMTAKVSFAKGVTLDKARVYYTNETVLNENTLWRRENCDYIDGEIFIEVPADTTYCYLNVMDSYKNEVTSYVINMR